MQKGIAFEKFDNHTNLLGKLNPNKPLVEILGQNRVLIENHSGVNCYNEKEVRIKVSFGQIRILGDHLELTQMTKYQLVITGLIECVKYCKGE